MDSDRRRHERYDNEHLILNVARPGIRGILSLNPTAECMNFSLAGMQFGTEEKLKVGERVVLDIGVDDVQLKELSGEIRSCKAQDDGTFCYSVRFCFNEKRMQKPDIRLSLLKIEDKLRMLTAYPDK